MNIGEILNITNDFILSINKSNIYIFIPGVNYLNIPYNENEVHEILKNNFKVLNSLKKLFI